MPRDSSDCYDLEGGALLCLVHRGQGHHYTPFAGQCPLKTVGPAPLPAQSVDVPRWRNPPLA